MTSVRKVSHTFFGILKSKKKPNLIVVGIPWFEFSTYRKCSLEGLKLLREATSSKIYNIFSESLTNLSEYWRIMDLGDMDIKRKTYHELSIEICETIKKTYREHSMFLFLGGDHSITYLTVKALKEVTDKELGLLYFDVHPDLYYEYEGNKYSHACVLRRIIEEGFVNPENILLIGVRAPTKEHIDFITKNKIMMISSKELSLKGIEIINSYIKAIDKNVDKVYLSFDLDVLDPAYVPGVSNPEPDGISTRM